MIKTCLDESANQFLECAVYICARKKLIHAMSLDIESPINRAGVVDISATRNYLKLHMPRTLKVQSCATLMPRRGSCGGILPGCRPSKQYPSINSLDIRCRRACRDAHSTIFCSPACRHCTSPRARVALTIEPSARIKSS